MRRTAAWGCSLRHFSLSGRGGGPTYSSATRCCGSGQHSTRRKYHEVFDVIQNIEKAGREVLIMRAILNQVLFSCFSRRRTLRAPRSVRLAGTPPGHRRAARDDRRQPARRHPRGVRGRPGDSSCYHSTTWNIEIISFNRCC